MIKADGCTADLTADSPEEYVVSSFDAIAAGWSPGELLEQIRSSGERLMRSASGLTGAEVRGPSRLDGWSRGQVLVHVAGAADAYVRLLDVARTGTEAGIEDSSGPDADLDASLTRLFARVPALPVPAWQNLVTARAGWRHPAWFTLLRCWRELETHHVDLDAGYEPADWPAAYVAWALDQTFATLAERDFPLARAEATDLGRIWKLTGGGPVVRAPAHVLLGWLAGRTPAPAPPLPDPPIWPLPPAPGWGRADAA
ncbi:maleylpyruvate isomerase family mycothiol-dependent enzyme [Actinoplanes regularis]|uniref:maleylpyruvate isomerase family mycothiol-dependent enzyme n=1 Tax=Actinoplanes regularis TaxID=52697 RepID=UPI000B76DA03|nr:maleylpyruvate isomerase family mycothiol-dependent enzyme [Actinoplanes regularis]GIE85495.1 maleylpyruvate isomerase [Actinoplanes regularis]